MTTSSSSEGFPQGGFVPSSAGFGSAAGTLAAGRAIEPTVGGVYSYAWNILKADFWSLLLVGFVAWLLVGLVPNVLRSIGDAGQGLAAIYQILVGIPATFGWAHAWLRAVRGEKPEVNDVFVPFQRNWFGTVLAGLLWEIVVIVGFILLIIPGIILAVRLSFVPFLVVEEGQGPVAALLESWNRTSGYGWTIFGAGLLGIVVVCVGLLILIIGSIPAAMWVYLAFASMYAAVTARKVGSLPAA